MAFYLAELITAAASDVATTADKAIVVDTIVDLWSQRRFFPHPRPLEDFAPVVDAVVRLADDSPLRFSRLRGIGDVTTNEATEPWVSMALSLERICQTAVLTLLSQAAEVAAETGGAWIEAVRGIADETEVAMTRRLASYAWKAQLGLEENKDDASSSNDLATFLEEVTAVDESEPVNASHTENARPLLGQSLRLMAETLTAVADQLEASILEHGGTTAQ
ncbi:MAG: hypothetical protein NTX29_07060 [Actinobacteria bacterium]|nr:hypothetical protein [Actinomycetota bacterium]